MVNCECGVKEGSMDGGGGVGVWTFLIFLNRDSEADKLAVVGDHVKFIFLVLPTLKCHPSH